MRLLTYRKGNGSPRVGAVRGPSVVDLTDLYPTMLALIDAGEAAIEQVKGRLADAQANEVGLGELTLCAPLPEPRQMRDAMCFAQHFEQAMVEMARLRVGRVGELAVRAGLVKPARVLYEQPIYYKCNRLSVVGPDAEVVWPAGAELMDYECEMAAVVGKRGKDIPEDQAMSHIFGFTIYNDFTARDLQEREMRGHLGPAKGKDFDTGNVLGPMIVTPDEIPDLYNLTMIARVNGQEWGRGNSGAMLHRWERLIAHVSRNETIYPGEVLGSGTVGNGCGLELGRYLQPGDEVELEITQLGTLRNRLVKP